MHQGGTVHRKIYTGVGVYAARNAEKYDYMDKIFTICLLICIYGYRK